MKLIYFLTALLSISFCPFLLSSVYISSFIDAARENGFTFSVVILNGTYFLGIYSLGKSSAYQKLIKIIVISKRNKQGCDGSKYSTPHCALLHIVAIVITVVSSWALSSGVQVELVLPDKFAPCQVVIELVYCKQPGFSNPCAVMRAVGTDRTCYPSRDGVCILCRTRSHDWQTDDVADNRQLNWNFDDCGWMYTNFLGVLQLKLVPCITFQLLIFYKTAGSVTARFIFKVVAWLTRVMFLTRSEGECYGGIREPSHFEHADAAQHQTEPKLHLPGTVNTRTHIRWHTSQGSRWATKYVWFIRPFRGYLCSEKLCY